MVTGHSEHRWLGWFALTPCDLSSSSREKLTEAAVKREPPQNPELSPARGKSKLTVPSVPTMLKYVAFL